MLETERVYVVSHREPSPVLWCDRCTMEMSMLTVDEAALILRSSSRAIFRLTEAGRLHSEESREGKLYICPTSLASVLGEE